MAIFAERTKVPVARSRAEIEQMITRYGASQFGSAIDNENHRAIIQFKCKDRQIRFVLPLPDPKKFPVTEHYARACRQKWRSLSLAIKAKLEAVQSGITHFEDEFMAHIVLPNGQTMSDYARPRIATMYETQQVKQFLITGPTDE